MVDEHLRKMEIAYKRCSDWSLHEDYTALLRQLLHHPLEQEHIDYLCEKILCKKHCWEIHLDHLRILLLNPSALKYNLRDFYAERVRHSRRPAIKIFFIRGYAMYADEAELTAIMKKFTASFLKAYDLLDFDYVMSAAGLKYLIKTYGYDCFQAAYDAILEDARVNKPHFRGTYTLDEQMNYVCTITPEERAERLRILREKYEAAVPEWFQSTQTDA